MKRLLTVAMVILLAAITTNTFAKEKHQFGKKELQNLTAAIESDNTGLKRNAIYLAGYYRIVEVTDVLWKELKTTDNPQTKILITLALYEIGDCSAIKNLADLSVDENEDFEVRKTAEALITEQKNRLIDSISKLK